MLVMDFIYLILIFILLFNKMNVLQNINNNILVQEPTRKNINLPPLAKSPPHGSSMKMVKDSFRSCIRLSREENSIAESAMLIHEDESTAL